MGRNIKRHAKLLERMFSRSEWEYLKRNPVFKIAIRLFNASKDESLEDVNNLTLLGNLLLQTWEDANPKRPLFVRAKAIEADFKLRHYQAERELTIIRATTRSAE